MARDYPHRITRRKLLKFTGHSMDFQQIKQRLNRHEIVRRALAEQGILYDPETGTFSRKPKEKGQTQ